MTKIASIILSTALLALSLNTTTQAQVWDDASMTYLFECKPDDQDYVRKMKGIKYCGSNYETDIETPDGRGRRGFD